MGVAHPFLDKLLFEPNLLSNERPTGEVELDLNEDLSVFTQLFVMPGINYRSKDFAKNTIVTESGPNIYTYNHVEIAKTDYQTLSLPVNTFSEMTVFIVFEEATLTTSGFNRVWSSLYSGVDDIRLYLNSNNIYVAWDDGTATTQTLLTGYSADTIYKAVFSHDGSTQRAWIFDKNNNLLNSVSNSDTFNFSGSATTTRLAHSGLSGDVGVHAKIYDYCVLNKAITSASVAQGFASDNYQLLKPTMSAVIPTAAAGGTTIPILAYHHNHNIGSHL